MNGGGQGAGTDRRVRVQLITRQAVDCDGGGGRQLIAMQAIDRDVGIDGGEELMAVEEGREEEEILWEVV